MSPFSCQAKRDIKYFPSRARQDKSGGSSARERWYKQREKGKDREGCREKEVELCLARTENRKTITGTRSPLPLLRISFFSFYLLSISSFPRLYLLHSRHPRHCMCSVCRVICKSAFEILNLDGRYADFAAQPVTRSLDTLPATRGLQFCDPAIRFLSQKEDARYHAISIDFEYLVQWICVRDKFLK